MSEGGVTPMVDPRTFERLAAEGFERLPAHIRAKIDNVALLIEDEPTEEDLLNNGLDPETETLLGLYHGIPLSARGEQYGVGVTMPDTITLFRYPIEDAAFDDSKDVRDVIAETIWHEYAHHFGMNEEEVRLREEERDEDMVHRG
ncbi:metallopeptidase family protein [Candidatus Kaiserbacteria bacterium]|nr:metallopeptidase family protein [Candidatus Kaiserbacteria bacterium]